MADIQPVGPANLLIDEQNPRIAVPNEGQHKALQSLAEHLGSKLSALAKHIVTYGMNPSDLPIVMPVPNRTGRYTVLEGNRRIAALKAMETPEAISGVVPARVLRRIRDLSKEYLQNPVDSIDCVVMPDRNEAQPGSSFDTQVRMRALVRSDGDLMKPTVLTREVESQRSTSRR